MEHAKVDAYIAVDGKIFTGDNAKLDCQFYEQRCLNEIESKFLNNIIIFNPDEFVNARFKDVYVYFYTEEGKSIFKLWCKLKEFYVYLDNIETKELNTWYKIIDYGDGYRFEIGNTINKIITNQQNCIDGLYNLLNQLNSISKGE